MLVESHGGHHRGDLGRQLGLEHGLSGHGVHAAVGDRRGHRGQLPGRHADRALARVDVQRHVGIVVDAVVILQQPCDRLVVEVGRRLRFVEFVDHRDVRSREVGDERDDGFPFAVAVAHGLDHRAGRNGSGVHQWRRGVVVFEQDGHDRVEGESRGVGADLAEHLLAAVLVHGEDRRGDLRHRFDAELVVRVAHGHHVAVGEAGRDAEQVRRHIGQIGDIVGVFAAGFVFAAVVCHLHGILNRFFVDLLNHVMKFVKWFVSSFRCGRP